MKLFFQYSCSKYYTSEELCILQNSGSSLMAKFELSKNNAPIYNLSSGPHITQFLVFVAKKWKNFE